MWLLPETTGTSDDRKTGGHVPTASELLEFERIGTDRFRARCNLDNYAGATFGGQALAQALTAAQCTAPDWPAQSLSGNFVRAGLVHRPIEFIVERVSDGRRFASRRVLAVQDDRPIFDMLCAFSDPRPGLQHDYSAFASVPEPDTLIDIQEFAIVNAHRLAPHAAALFARPFPIELRLLDPEAFFDRRGVPIRNFWFRVPSAEVLQLPAQHQALLALASDYWFASVICAPHASHGAPRSVASLNHSMWFHRPVRTDMWMLYHTETPWADHGRGLARGEIYDCKGRLIASTAQEALVRIEAERKDGQ